MIQSKVDFKQIYFVIKILQFNPSWIAFDPYFWPIEMISLVSYNLDTSQKQFKTLIHSDVTKQLFPKIKSKINGYMHRYFANIKILRLITFDPQTILSGIIWIKWFGSTGLFDERRKAIFPK